MTMAPVEAAAQSFSLNSVVAVATRPGMVASDRAAPSARDVFGMDLSIQSGTHMHPMQTRTRRNIMKFNIPDPFAVFSDMYSE